jgi:hypothetical protein
MSDGLWVRWWAIIRPKNGDNAGSEPARSDHAHDDHSPNESCAAVGSAEGGAGQRPRPAPRRCDPPASLNPMDSDLQRLADACNRAAEHYCEHPATPETVVDIYRAMAALASMLDSKVKTQPLLQRKLH